MSKEQNKCKVVHDLYVKAGLIKKPKGYFYKLRVHSIRKFFRTQRSSLGIQSDYIQYMMGHKRDIYHDIEMKGIEFLRNIYATSGISIKPKTNTNKKELLEEMIRAFGYDPEKVLSRDAFIQPARTYISSKERENNQLAILSKTLRDIIRQDRQQES